jgi:hypothetical protein
MVGDGVRTRFMCLETADVCEHRNELSGSMTGSKFLDQLGDRCQAALCSLELYDLTSNSNLLFGEVIPLQGLQTTSKENHGGMLSTGENGFVHQSSLPILPAVSPTSIARGTGERND